MAIIPHRLRSRWGNVTVVRGLYYSVHKTAHVTSERARETFERGGKGIISKDASTWMKRLTPSVMSCLMADGSGSLDSGPVVVYSLFCPQFVRVL